MNIGIKLSGRSVGAKPDIRVLRAQLDTTFRWKAQFREVQAKLILRNKAQQLVTGSTREPLVAAVEHVYSTIARPVPSHGASVWYTREGIKRHRKTMARKLRSIQGK